METHTLHLLCLLSLHTLASCFTGRADYPQASRGAWRLPGVGGEWGVEERDIRVPPLPRGACFADVYEVKGMP